MQTEEDEVRKEAATSEKEDSELFDKVPNLNESKVDEIPVDAMELAKLSKEIFDKDFEASLLDTGRELVCKAVDKDTEALKQFVTDQPTDLVKQTIVQLNKESMNLLAEIQEGRKVETNPLDLLHTCLSLCKLRQYQDSLMSLTLNNLACYHKKTQKPNVAL